MRISQRVEELMGDHKATQLLLLESKNWRVIQIATASKEQWPILGGIRTDLSFVPKANDVANTYLCR